MSTWKALCEQAMPNADKAHFVMSCKNFDKIRAVVENAARFSRSHLEVRGYDGCTALNKALKDLGVIE